mmetsp:Transcript_6209/g.4394  ORF Transcript_6209/g.4394 Transcript_6209/m.4394 type:complete len:83 (-) Transcript_6209:410-658(-)
MKTNIYQVASIHGEVTQVTLNQTNCMRGQAFVVFREQTMADKALQELKGFCLFGKQMDVQYARQASDITLQMKGSFANSIRI